MAASEEAGQSEEGGCHRGRGDLGDELRELAEGSLHFAPPFPATPSSL